MSTRPYAYRHVIATLHGCRNDLTDEKLLVNATLRAIRNANMHLAKTRMENPLVYRVGDDIMGGGVSIKCPYHDEPPDAPHIKPSQDDGI